MTVKYRGGHITLKEIKDSWGPECPDFDPGCCLCQTWTTWKFEQVLKSKARADRFNTDLEDERERASFNVKLDTLRVKVNPKGKEAKIKKAEWDKTFKAPGSWANVAKVLKGRNR